MSTATLLILAQRVRDHGHGRDERLGLCVERHLSLRSGLAGACLLPLSQIRQAVHPRAGAGARHSRLRARVFIQLLVALLTGPIASSARAQTSVPASTSTPSPPSGRIGGETPPSPCVVVDIAGHKAGHLDCASQTLEAAARTAQAQARSGLETPVISATSSDVRTGVANQTATRQRMGNSFGTSVHPQRPNRPPSVPRPGGRP